MVTVRDMSTGCYCSYDGNKVKEDSTSQKFTITRDGKTIAFVPTCYVVEMEPPVDTGNLVKEEVADILNNMEAVQSVTDLSARMESRGPVH